MRYIPAGEVEGCQRRAAFKHLAKVRGTRHVPTGNVEGRQRRAALEHLREILHARNVPAGEVERGQALHLAEQAEETGLAAQVRARDIEGLQAFAGRGVENAQDGTDGVDIAVGKLELAERRAVIKHDRLRTTKVSQLRNVGEPPTGQVKGCERLAAVEHVVK